MSWILDTKLLTRVKVALNMQGWGSKLLHILTYSYFHSVNMNMSKVFIQGQRKITIRGGGGGIERGGKGKKESERFWLFR
jgi:hypothetical protein